MAGCFRTLLAVAGNLESLRGPSGDVNCRRESKHARRFGQELLAVETSVPASDRRAYRLQVLRAIVLNDLIVIHPAGTGRSRFSLVCGDPHARCRVAFFAYDLITAASVVRPRVVAQAWADPEIASSHRRFSPGLHDRLCRRDARPVPNAIFFLHPRAHASSNRP